MHEMYWLHGYRECLPNVQPHLYPLNRLTCETQSYLLRELTDHWHNLVTKVCNRSHLPLAVPDCMLNEGFSVWSQEPAEQWSHPSISFLIWGGMLGLNVSYVYGDWHQAKPYSALQCFHPSSRCCITQEWGLKGKQKSYNHNQKTNNSWSDSHVQRYDSTV